MLVSFLSDHLEQNGKSTGDITPQSLWKPGEIMSPPPKLRGQTEQQLEQLETAENVDMDLSQSVLFSFSVFQS